MLLRLHRKPTDHGILSTYSSLRSGRLVEIRSSSKSRRRAPSLAPTKGYPNLGYSFSLFEFQVNASTGADDKRPRPRLKSRNGSLNGRLIRPAAGSWYLGSFLGFPVPHTVKFPRISNQATCQSNPTAKSVRALSWSSGRSFFAFSNDSRENLQLRAFN